MTRHIPKIHKALKTISLLNLVRITRVVRRFPALDLAVQISVPKLRMLTSWSWSLNKKGRYSLLHKFGIHQPIKGPIWSKKKGMVESVMDSVLLEDGVAARTSLVQSRWPQDSSKWPQDSERAQSACVSHRRCFYMVQTIWHLGR